MKKAILIIVVLAVIVAALRLILRPEPEDELHSFPAVILEKDAHSMLVEGKEDNDVNFRGQFSLFISSSTAVPWEMPEVGDTILISFTGQMLETSPVQIPTVTAIELISKGGMRNESFQSYEAAFVRADGTGEGLHTLFPLLENGDTLYLSSAQHLPVIKLDSPLLLQDFMQRVSADDQFFPLDSEFDGAAFTESVAHCDEAFFQENTLLIVYITEGSGSVRHEISALNIENGTVFVGVRRLVPEVGTADMAGWFAVLEVPNELLVGCTTFDAAIHNG